MCKYNMYNIRPYLAVVYTHDTRKSSRCRVHSLRRDVVKNKVDVETIKRFVIHLLYYIRHKYTYLQ